MEVAILAGELGKSNYSPLFFWNDRKVFSLNEKIKSSESIQKYYFSRVLRSYNCSFI
jgi:hypothetical protein